MSELALLILAGYLSFLGCFLAVFMAIGRQNRESDRISAEHYAALRAEFTEAVEADIAQTLSLFDEPSNVHVLKPR